MDGVFYILIWIKRDSANAVPNANKFCARVFIICENRQRQPDRSAMIRSRLGRREFVIAHTTTPGKYAFQPAHSFYLLKQVNQNPDVLFTNTQQLLIFIRYSNSLTGTEKINIILRIFIALRKEGKNDIATSLLRKNYIFLRFFLGILF